MIIGFTGTRKGMTDGQCSYVEHELRRLGATEFHHGDCVGADSQAAYLVRSMGTIKIVAHPPTIDTYRAKVPLRPMDRSLMPKPYLERNRDIVDACDHLLVAPRTNIEQQRGSGTWSTFRYAQGNLTPITMIER